MPSRTVHGIDTLSLALARRGASRRALLAGAAALGAGLAPAGPTAAKAKGKGKRKKACTVHDGAELAAAIAGAADGATLRLCAGTFAGSFTVGKPLRLVGAGAAATTVVADSAVPRVLSFTSGRSSLSGVTVDGGPHRAGGILVGASLALGGCVVRNCSYTQGGGILVEPGGTLSATQCTIGGTSPGDANHASFGGGAWNGGTMTLTKCRVLGNVASLNGGGLANGSAATLTLDGTTVAGNSAGEQGGGIVNTWKLVVRNGSVVGGTTAAAANHAANGGGLANTGTATFAKGTTLTGIVAPALGDGGGIYQQSPGSVSLPAKPVVVGNHPDNCEGTPIANCVN